MTVKDYSSLYNIKEFMKNEVAPTYFDMEQISDLNIGIFGYISEILATNVEDSMLVTTMLFKEQFPVIAEKPESLYLCASLFQLENLFATPSTVNFILLLNEDSIMKNGAEVNEFVQLDIDSNMDINIEDKHFMLDYDVRIQCMKTSKGYVYNAYYIMDHTNSLSHIVNPYIKTVIHTNDNNQRYLGLYLTLRQVTKTTTTRTIITNDKINVVREEYEFSGQIAGFEVYYRETSGSQQQQLIKRPANTTKVSNPFCFYRFQNENKLIIEFANDERYFLPKFNSELQVDIYTTLGADGNFSEYTGTEVQVIGKSTKYTSNKGLIFIGSVQGAAMGGFDKISMDEFRDEIIKAWSTVQSFTTDNDLTLFFNSLKIKELNDILIIKQRNDALMRLFSCFVLFRDQDNNVIPTNTVDMRIYQDEIDVSYPQSDRYVMKAGKIYAYDGTSRMFVKQRKDLTLSSDLDQFEGKEFVYVNPFLTVVSSSPSIGFYLNTIDDNITLDYSEITSQTIYQFIVNTLDIYRDAINGEEGYTITAKLTPTASLPVEAFELVTEDMLITENDRTFINPTDGLQYKDLGLIKAIVCIKDDDGTINHYIDLELTGFDESAYFMTQVVNTTDYVNLENKLEVSSGIKDRHTAEDAGEHVLITSYGCNLELYTFYMLPDGEKYFHEFDDNPELQPYTLTNKYVINPNTQVNFMIPVPEIICTLVYVKGTGDSDFTNYECSKVPLVKANYLCKRENFKYFLSTFNNIYYYIRLSMDQLTNNFDINLKFFNTYGYSRHYIVPSDVDVTNIINNCNCGCPNCYCNQDKPILVENGETYLINRVNIKMTYDVKFTINTDTDSTVASIKDYIRNYVESSEISLISKPNLSISKLTAELVNNFSQIDYLIFRGIDNYGESLQYIESEITEENIIQSNFSTADVVPEYLNIDYLYKENTKALQVTINVL